MPAVPEVGHTVRLIGRIEVDREAESQQKGDTDSHVTVSGEIAIDLQGISINAEKVFDTGIQARIVEDSFYEIDTDVVGNHSFLEQTADNQENSLSEHLGTDVERTADLGNKVTGPHNRSGHKLRKERYIKSIVQQTVQRTEIATIDINGITE